MKIVDEKGRLFGKINIIDFLVVLFLLCLMPMFYFGYKILAKKPAPVPVVGEAFDLVAEEKWLSLQVKFPGVIGEVAIAIQKGDTEKDDFDKTVARIQSIISNNPSQIVSVKEGEVIILTHPFNKDLLLSLDVLCMEKKGVYYFKSYPVKLGNNIVFCTDLYSISGIIIGMELE